MLSDEQMKAMVTSDLDQLQELLLSPGASELLLTLIPIVVQDGFKGLVPLCAEDQNVSESLALLFVYSVGKLAEVLSNREELNS